MLVNRSKCPACDSNKAKTLFREQYKAPLIRDYISNYYNLEKRELLATYDQLVGDEFYELRECLGCKLIFQSAYPNEEFSQIIYAEWIKTRDLAVDDATGISFIGAKHYMSEALKLTSLTMRLTGKEKPGQLRVLDFGMGQGAFLSALKACGCDVYGYDIAEDRQQHGVSLGAKMVGLSDIALLEFDLINTEQVFEHLPEPLETARMLSGVLAPNGLLKISVPFNRWLEKGDFEINWKAGRYSKHSPIPNAPLEHLQYFRRPSLDHLSKRLHLDRVKISKIEHLQLSLDWLKPLTAVKNLGRILAFERFRNYYIFQRPNTGANIPQSPE